MEQLTRVELLLELIKKDNDTDMEVFDLLIPNFYSEMYSLYNILNKADILDQCEFQPPHEFLGDISFPISLGKKPIKKIMSYLESKKFVVKYLKTDEFKIDIHENNKGIVIAFKRIE